MTIFQSMLPRLFTGTGIQRVQAGCILAAWFCLGAFVVSVVAPYLDRVIPGDQSSLLVVAAGGVAAVIGAVATKVA